MKNIDIDKVDRNMIYKVPPDFFSEMQQNVLHAVEAEEKHRKATVFPLKWMYSVAAAVVLFFGLTVFLFHDYSNGTIAHLKQNTAERQLNLEAPASMKTGIAKMEVRPDTSPATEKDYSERSRNKLSASIQTEAVVSGSSARSTYEKNAENHDLNDHIEALVSSYSPSELADIAGKAAPDVYLDLFD